MQENKNKISAHFDDWKEDIPKPCQRTLNRISSYTTKPDRTIFIDRYNDNAWISADNIVEIKR